MPTDRHMQIEQRFTRILTDEGYAPPDRVLYEERAVGFVYDEPKVVIYIDFDDDGTPTDVREAV